MSSKNSEKIIIKLRFTTLTDVQIKDQLGKMKKTKTKKNTQTKHLDINTYAVPNLFF